MSLHHSHLLLNLLNCRRDFYPADYNATNRVPGFANFLPGYAMGYYRLATCFIQKDF